MTSTTIPTLDLSTTPDVQTYLASFSLFRSSQVAPLSGGTANYVYRIRLEEPYKGKETLILKHAKPYVKNAHRLAFDVGRQVHEVEALRRVRAWLAPNPTSFVTVPEVHHFDETEHVIIMDDAGSNTLHLKDFMQLSPSNGGPTPALAIQIGDAIGTFLGQLHAWGRGNTGLCEFMRGNEMARKMSSWAFYGRLVDVVKKTPKLNDPPIDVSEKDWDVMDRLAKETVQAMLDAKDSFVMGDFWPGNLMVVLNGQGELKNIVVLDWELAKTGLTGIEVGQFCAEIHLLRRCVPEVCKETASLVLEHFFKEYVKYSQPDIGVARRAIVQWGTHMTILGEIWGDKDLTRAVVSEGIRIMVDGYEGDIEALRESFVGPLVPS